VEEIPVNINVFSDDIMPDSGRNFHENCAGGQIKK
jgi:hypothetical protein